MLRSSSTTLDNCSVPPPAPGGPYGDERLPVQSGCGTVIRARRMVATELDARRGWPVLGRRWQRCTSRAGVRCLWRGTIPRGGGLDGSHRCRRTASRRRGAGGQQTRRPPAGSPDRDLPDGRSPPRGSTRPEPPTFVARCGDRCVRPSEPPAPRALVSEQQDDDHPAHGRQEPGHRKPDEEVVALAATPQSDKHTGDEVEKRNPEQDGG